MSDDPTNSIEALSAGIGIFGRDGKENSLFGFGSVQVLRLQGSVRFGFSLGNVRFSVVLT